MQSDFYLKGIINTSVGEVLERMKHVNAEDRYHLLLEHGEWIFNEFDIDDEMVVPNNLLSGHE